MTRREILADGIELWLGDCREILPTLGNVDAVVTSPPYDGIREYGEGFSGFDWKTTITHLAKIVNEGGVIVWNVADQTVNGSETGTSFKQALHAMDCGLRLHDTMIYCKEGVTFPDNNRYHPAFEYVFVFSNGSPKSFNGLKDWRNKSYGRVISGTDRLADGSTKQVNGIGNLVPEMGLRRNWWIIANPYKGETGGHPAPMPFSLAYDHIITWTEPGDLVADPCMGSGTSGVAAARLGRNFVGIEINPEYFDIAVRRISDALKRPDLFIPAPAPKAKQESLL